MSDDPYRAPESRPVPEHSEGSILFRPIPGSRVFALLLAIGVLLCLILEAYFVFRSQEVPPGPGGFYHESTKPDTSEESMPDD